MSAGPGPPKRAGLVRAAVEAALVAATACLLVGLNTRLNAPPRFDGAGYAVLGEALATGQGYREIDRPDRPLHAHYPPGYPIALAMLWRLSGRSAAAAHLLSLACTVLTVFLGWLCFRRLYRHLPGVAFVLGLALACNWTWGRAGGEIQSEPLFLLLEMLALFLALSNQSHDRLTAGLALGATLGICVLTRHVGAVLAAAVLLDLWLRKRLQNLLAAGVMIAVLVTPWAAWVAMVRQNTQVALLARGGFVGRVADNAIFYLRRIPDQITGPVVEVATIFGRSAWVAGLATAWAFFATGLVVLGWFLCLRFPRSRLMGLVPLFTLGLLLVWPFTEAGRFLIPLVPFVLVGSVEGVARLGAVAGGRMAGRRFRRNARLAAGLVVLIASAPYTAYSVITDRTGARQRSHADFDAACAWITQKASRPGPIMTRQPGEVYWLTGRLAVLPQGDDLEAIERLIDRDKVAYLLVDQERYARAPTNPLRRLVERRPDRFHEVWSATREQVVSQPSKSPEARWPRMSIYAVSPEHPVSGLGPRR